MKFLPLLSLLGLFVSAGICPADVITTFNFNDAIWDVQTTETTAGIANDPPNHIQFGGSTLVAQRDQSATAGGSVIVTATLVGAISTAGFENIELEFTNQSVGVEYDGSDFVSASNDGFALSSSDGLGFSTLNANSTFRNALDTFGFVWTQASAATHGQDLVFDSVVDNGAVTDLVIQLKVNNTNDLLRLANLTLTGTVATPEPSTFVLISVCAVGFLFYRRRQQTTDARQRTCR